MEHPLPVQRTTIAWFKLAEFVTRKEKERAIVALRLLSHSIANQACSLLIEADLLNAFKDERAIQVYERSAKLYAENNEPAQAAFIYEYLAQATGDIGYLQTAMHLCLKEGFRSTWSRCAAQVGRVLIGSGKYDQLVTLMDQLYLDASWSAWVVGELIVAAVRQESFPHELLKELTDHMVAVCMAAPDGRSYLSQMLARLAVVQPAAHERISRLCGIVSPNDYTPINAS